MYSKKEELFYGIWKYSDVFTEDLNLINRIESEVLKSVVSWKKAKVGLEHEVSEYRNCSDFKLSELGKTHDLYKDIYRVQEPCVKDYCAMYSIDMEYWEWTNIIKYGPGQHFQEHADHGWSYVSTVSLVGYPNDEYTGGELYFPKFNLSIAPKAGDLYIFPSSFIYSHVAMPVKSGTKYCFATMLDYNDDAHSKEFDQYIERKHQIERSLV
jgi:hypothetical protein